MLFLISFTVAPTIAQVTPTPESLLPVILALPDTMPLNHAACFRSEGDSVLTFDELAANLGGTDDARHHLQHWGWQASANRTFACDTPPEGEASSIDISLHLFADAASAQQAVDYFAGVRAEGAPLIAAAPPPIGDHAAVLSGPTTNGKEFTLYVSRGPLLIRVTGVSSSGIPFNNVLTVAQSLLAMPLPEPQTPSTPDAVEYLPGTLPLGHASCFRVDGEGTLDFSALVERFPRVPDAASRLQDLGWVTGAYRQFGCDGPPTGHVGWIDISVHQFQDAASAEAAVPLFASTRALGSELETAPAPSIGDSTSALAGPASNGTEYTLYMSTGSLLFRVTGVAPAGDPAPDVQQVMLGVVAGSLLVGQDESPPTQAPALPTATAIPTPTVIPTATASPTATVTPIPTPTVPPTSTPTSTATPLPTPTATVVPTATPMSLPTAVPELVLTPVAVEPTTRPTGTVVPSSTGCELVELYPGYPGYRGYVTGIDGPGEVACLDNLLAANPSFDKAAEDAANLAAAQAIGLGGTPKDWTWENWMAVEAERGLPRICYSCLFRDPGPQEGGQRAAWDPADPRLQLGGYGTSQAIAGALSRVGVEPGGNTEALFQRILDPNDEDDLGADHVLRALMGAAWPGHHTALEMLSAYDDLFAELMKNGTYINIDPLWKSMLAQGGYAPTPPGADIEDQLYMIRTGMEARCAGMPEDFCETELSLYDRFESQFLVEVGSTQLGADISYAAWLRENYPDLF
jgi:hypothetical protein